MASRAAGMQTVAAKDDELLKNTFCHCKLDGGGVSVAHWSGPMDLEAELDFEQDCRFPSGPWKGFFLQQQFPGRNWMDLQLTFRRGEVHGDGRDWIGAFLLIGRYDVETGRCWLTKRYVAKHDVSYQGYNEGKGIWGVWEIPPLWRGGFHIWPVAMGDPGIEALAESIEEPEAVPVDANQCIGLHIDGSSRAPSFCANGDEHSPRARYDRSFSAFVACLLVLIAATVSATLISLWSVWPVATAHDFVGEIAARQYVAQGASITPASNYNGSVPDYICRNWQKDFQRRGIVWDPFSLSDFLCGRRRFATEKRSGLVYFEFTAVRGSVSQRSVIAQ